MKKSMLLISLMLLVFCTNTTSAKVNIPYAFKAGEAAKAAEVNANFKALQDAVEQLQTAVAELESLGKENRALKTTIGDLQAQIGELKKQVAALQKQGLAAVTPTQIPAEKGARLRSKPVTVSDDEANQQFKLNDDSQPLNYIENQFKDQGEVVTDHATGLTWQKSGSENAMTYQETQAYIKQLNQGRFAGYRDWRLPTVDELLSLVEQDKQSNGLYINSLFDSTQMWCWSADKSSLEWAWRVTFSEGVVRYGLNAVFYVRAVRP